MNNVNVDQGIIWLDSSECLKGFACLLSLISHKEPWQVRLWKHLNTHLSHACRTSCSRFHTLNRSVHSCVLMVVENLLQPPLGEVVWEVSWKKPKWENLPLDPLLGIKIVKNGERNCFGSERRTISPTGGSGGDVLKKAKIKYHASKWMWHELLSNSSWHTRGRSSLLPRL